MNRSLADRTIKVALAAAIVLLLIMGAISSWSRVESSRSERWVQHTHEVLEKLQGLALAVETAKSSYREFALTGDEAALRPFEKNESEAMQDVAAVRRLTSDNASQQRRIAVIERLTTQRIEFAEKVIVLRRTHGTEAAADAVRSVQNGQLVAEFDAAVGAAEAEELRLLALRNAEAAKRLRQTNASLVGLILLALFLVALTGRKLWHESAGRRSAEKLLRDEEAVTALLDLTHDAIFVRDRKDQIVFWNKAAERLYGWSKAEAVGKVTHELLHTVFPAPLADIDAEVVLNGYWEGDLIHERRDGTALTVSSRWGVQFDGRGVLIGVLESNRDISRHQREDRRIQGLLEAPPDAMVVVNQNGEIVLLNHQAARKFGYATDELVGAKVTTIIPEGFAERLIADGSRSAAEALMQQMGTGVELRGRRKDGDHFPIEIMLTPLENADGIPFPRPRSS